MISSCLGVYENDGIVQYIANGLPIYGHAPEGLQSFRFITINFINQGLCKATEVARCFGISVDTATRYFIKSILQKLIQHINQLLFINYYNIPRLYFN